MMTQILHLLQKGNRSQPTIYRFGAKETLCLYNDQKSTIEICDNKGCHIRSLNSYDLIAMGYSPAKLLEGSKIDQLVDKTKTAFSEHILNAIRGFLFTAILGVTLITAGNITGCNDYVIQQAEQDIATTTINPVDNYYNQIALGSGE